MLPRSSSPRVKIRTDGNDDNAFGVKFQGGVVGHVNPFSSRLRALDYLSSMLWRDRVHNGCVRTIVGHRNAERLRPLMANNNIHRDQVRSIAHAITLSRLKQQMF